MLLRDPQAGGSFGGLGLMVFASNHIRQIEAGSSLRQKIVLGSNDSSPAGLSQCFPLQPAQTILVPFDHKTAVGKTGI